jgi:hypothetical protein
MPSRGTKAVAHDHGSQTCDLRLRPSRERDPHYHKQVHFARHISIEMLLFRLHFTTRYDDRGKKMAAFAVILALHTRSDCTIGNCFYRFAHW